MRHRPEPRPDPELLTPATAERLLGRASELDAARSAGYAVAELRATALEAGISTEAFDAALAEMRTAGNAPAVTVQRKQPRRVLAWVIATVTALLVAVGALGLAREPAADIGGPALVEEVVMLRCLSSSEAAEMVRPLLAPGSRTTVSTSERTPRVLTVRGTPAEVREVMLLLDRHEGRGSAACAARSPGAGPANR